jgi:hypothetical protein
VAAQFVNQFIFKYEENAIRHDFKNSKYKKAVPLHAMEALGGR